MKVSISNIALPEYDHLTYLPKLKEIGFDGLEVATSRIWQTPLDSVSFKDVESYRERVTESGLEIVGLHSLLYGLNSYNIFSEYSSYNKVVKYFRLLATVCHDLGGKTLIYGGGRKRGDLEYGLAKEKLYRFVDDILPNLEKERICLCFEPLSRIDTDIISTIAESLAFVKRYNSPYLRVQIDVKAMIDNNDLNISELIKIKPYLEHVHVNSTSLGVIGGDNLDEHKTISKLLNACSYDNFITIEQIMINPDNILDPISQSYSFVKKYYIE